MCVPSMFVDDVKAIVNLNLCACKLDGTLRCCPGISGASQSMSKVTTEGFVSEAGFVAVGTHRPKCPISVGSLIEP